MKTLPEVLATTGMWDLATWSELGSAVAAIISAVTLIFVCRQIHPLCFSFA